MVIIRCGKIINPVTFPLNEIDSVVIRRIEKWEHMYFYRKVRTDDLELVIYTKIKPKSQTEFCHTYNLYPGNVIKNNDVKITVPDLTGLEEERKDFIVKKLSEDLNLCIMLEQNSI